MTREQIIERLSNPPQLEIKSKDELIQLQQDYVSRLEDFIFRQHNYLEIGDLEDVFLVSNIITSRKEAA